MVATPNKDQSLQDALPCKLMLDWYPRTVPSASYKTKGKVWPIIGILPLYACADGSAYSAFTRSRRLDREYGISD